jgi:hypothetical protein
VDESGITLGNSNFNDTVSLVTCDVPLNVTGAIKSTDYLQSRRVRVWPGYSPTGVSSNWLGHGGYYSGLLASGNILVKFPNLNTGSTYNVMAKFTVHIIDFRANCLDTMLTVSGYTYYSSATAIYWYYPKVVVNNPFHNISKVKLGYDKTDGKWCIAIKPVAAWSYPNVHVDALIGYTGSYHVVWESTMTTVSVVDDTTT